MNVKQKKKFLMYASWDKKAQLKRVKQTTEFFLEDPSGRRRVSWIYRKGDFVLEYSGELIDSREAKNRESTYSLDTTKGSYIIYVQYREKRMCIDATPESCRYGSKIVMLGEIPRLILVAKQNIGLDTELHYDYGDRKKESLQGNLWLAY